MSLLVLCSLKETCSNPKYNSRFSNLDTTLETIVEGTLTTTTSKNLSLDDELLGVYK